MAYGRRRRAPNKGKTCKRYKRVRMRGNGIVRRCASYGAKRGSTWGHRRRPYNRGKKCVEMGLNRLGKPTCRSYGKVYGGKFKNRRKSRPSDTFIHNVQRAMAERQRAAVEAREDYGFWPFMMVS